MEVEVYVLISNEKRTGYGNVIFEEVISQIVSLNEFFKKHSSFEPIWSFVFGWYDFNEIQ